MNRGDDVGPGAWPERLLAAAFLALGLALWVGLGLVLVVGLLVWGGYQSGFVLGAGGTGVLLVFVSALARGYW